MVIVLFGVIVVWFWLNGVGWFICGFLLIWIVNFLCVIVVGLMWIVEFIMIVLVCVFMIIFVDGLVEMMLRFLIVDIKVV